MNQAQIIAEKIGALSANHGLRDDYFTALQSAELVMRLIGKALKYDLTNDEVMTDIRHALNERNQTK